MNIGAIGRIGLTTLACFAVASLVFALVGIEHGSILSVFLFSTTVTLTNQDRLRISAQMAVLWGILLSVALMFIALFATIGISEWLGLPGFYALFALSAGLMYLVLAVCVQMSSFKTGLVVSLLLGLLVFPVSEYIATLNIYSNTDSANDFRNSLYFICWQTLTATGIGAGIWLDVQTKFPFIRKQGARRSSSF